MVEMRMIDFSKYAREIILVTTDKYSEEYTGIGTVYLSYTPEANRAQVYVEVLSVRIKLPKIR